MFRTARSYTRRLLLVTGLVLVGLAASAATTHTPSPSPESTLVNQIPSATNRANSAYFAEFTGVGAEGRDMVWRGAIAGAVVGELTVRLAHEGRDVDTAKPTWPVEGIIFVSGEGVRRAFAAEVSGTIDWLTNRVKLAGEVSVGCLRGAHVELTADLVDYNLSGELRFAPTTLALAR